MLDTIGYGSVDDLMDAAIPEVIRWHGTLDLPAAATEAEALAELRALADRNQPLVSMIGLGYYGTDTPAVVRRNVLESPPGTRRTRPTSRRSARGGSRRCSTSRP